MPPWLNTDFIESSIFWSLLQFAFLSLIASLASTLMLKRVFDLLPERKKTFTFFGIMAAFLFLVFVGFGIKLPARPIMTASIDTAITAGQLFSTANVGDGPTDVFLLVEIANRGTLPSSLIGFSLDIEINGSVFHGVRSTIPQVVTLKTPTTTYRFVGSDSLIVKASSAPIPVGGVVSGLLGFRFLSLREAALPGTDAKMTLSFEDTFGNTYQARVVDLENNTFSEIPDLPGVEMQRLPGPSAYSSAP